MKENMQLGPGLTQHARHIAAEVSRQVMMGLSPLHDEHAQAWALPCLQSVILLFLSSTGMFCLRVVGSLLSMASTMCVAETKHLQQHWCPKNNHTIV